MHVILTVLLALPAANPTPGYRFDGDWTIVSVEYNGKTSEAKATVAISKHRLVLNEGKGEQQITIEFDPNNRSWLWAGKNKPPTTPPPPEEVPLMIGQRIAYPGNETWIIDPVSRLPVRAPTVLIPARYVTLATPGFYLTNKDQLQVFFLPIDGAGPSLTLVLKREGEKK